jgi:hypothetical protein
VAVIKELMQERAWRVTPRIHTNKRDESYE